ncbi:MAG: isoleucine--tRNA ligase [Candidatus Harrisonbacteria bacterium CG10_big_fil_rev_8_21_14_0_10_42_17]|uniref:Isoleucine--tRNA ligase n=1 Tax=Candidatus Harrisonbacteria bacterium CG10_big_fil_rev_8_21_14_0_10_42_17 TaxID=1974584 RepID=A0A2M6WJ66_9BACT|nr:MAG: isoleucine--tRNA ligase [Candidatus Harrisonbacteria bacterium CG10_big_fil_rev_8_21_14_0_10_42_17]
MFKNENDLNLPELEEAILKQWDEKRIFEQSLINREGKEIFNFYEGPPTANGKPGFHHLISRSFKDIIPRYKAMRGYYVPRKGGWDTHGLPVEIQVEKELGFNSKKEIEAYGVEKFNTRAKETVWGYRSDWEKLTRRMGFWLDLDDAYVTYHNDYIESLWWIFGEAHKKKLLIKGFKIASWCTRCGTALSSHELAQGYKDVTDTSIYVKFKVNKGEVIGNFVADDKTYILSWTTTSWTLPGNVALAAGKDIHYSIVSGEDGTYILGSSRVNSVLGDDVKRNGEISGSDLEGISYKQLFSVAKLKHEKSFKVYLGDFVTDVDGTGVVHTAVMYGEDDYRLGKELGLPEYHTVQEDGTFVGVPGLNGKYVKHPETEKMIFAHLEEKGFLLKTEKYKHEYPHCWRCDTPLLYYARESWFIEMSKLRDQLVANNKKINWFPGHIKEGRFGEWLREVKDWNISRERYWGTPLPIWECLSCEKVHVVSSLQELDKHAVSSNTFFIARHGEATSNVQGILAGGKETKKTAAVLTERGREQALHSAEHLKKEHIDLIITSPFQRTRETAEIYAKATGAHVLVDERFHETDGGVLNGRPLEEYFSFASEEKKFTTAPEKGEHWNQVKARMMEAVLDINRTYSGKRILLISHGRPLLMLASALEGLSDQEILRKKDIHTGQYEKITVHNWPYNKAGNLDVHRPFIDEIKLKCAKCKGEMSRVLGVADVWFDSGAMPFAQWHYPYENKNFIDKGERYPADYICEALDQTRGWFYTLLAIATLLDKEVPYKNVITLGLILDKHGKKMSKSKGNIVNPWEIIERYGVDAIRWYLFTTTEYAEPKRFDEGDVLKSYRKFFLLFHNSFSFLRTYADSGLQFQTKQPKHALDIWILARLYETERYVTNHLDSYEIVRAARSIEDFLSDVSQWYIRRSRKRLQGSIEARNTLFTVFVELTKLSAPFAPFFSDALYQTLGAMSSESFKPSVHLEDWPHLPEVFENSSVLNDIRDLRTLVTQALALRAEAGIKVRQPLAELRIKNNELGIKNDDELLDLLKDEVNVKQIVFDSSLKFDLQLDTTITPILKQEGIAREIIRFIQQMRQKSGLRVSDGIEVHIEGDETILRAIQAFEQEVTSIVGAKTCVCSSARTARFENSTHELDTKLEDQPLWIGIRKL